MSEIVYLKRCNRCNEEKLFENFYTNYAFCKSCYREGRQVKLACVDCGKEAFRDISCTWKRSEYRCKSCGTSRGIQKSFEDPVKHQAWKDRTDGKGMRAKVKVMRGVKGSANHFWKGGVTYENEKARWSCETKTWRKAVLKRDNYKCRLCGTAELKYLQAHHRLMWSEDLEARHNLDNGVTLCSDCHFHIVHRGYWKNEPLDFWV